MKGTDQHQNLGNSPSPPKTIARRLAMGFGLVSIVAVIMCGILISLLNQVADLVQQMHDDDRASVNSLALATSIREQYIHQAHWIIEGGDEHLAHYEEARQQVQERVRALGPLVPKHSETLATIATDSRELDRIFHREIRPAVLSGDTQTLTRSHRRAATISQNAAGAADQVAHSVEARIARAHALATRVTTIGLLSGAACVLLVLALSMWFTVRLRKSVVLPLQVLALAAKQFGEGNFESRLGNVGEGELFTVAQAFDAMAQELEERERRLIVSERMAAIGELAAGVAHEINNPIQVIRGYLKTMTPNAPAEELEAELQILDEEAAACQRIADDLLAYSHSTDLQLQSVDMKFFLEQTARRFREGPGGFKRDVDVTAQTATVVFDPGRLRQVLFNLLVNAAQVSKPDQRIQIVGTSAETSYTISVLDCGTGLSDQDKGKIFEPFFSKRAGGSGLGLAVSLGLVRAHGGTIVAIDHIGGGTILRIVLPKDNRGEHS